MTELNAALATPADAVPSAAPAQLIVLEKVRAAAEQNLSTSLARSIVDQLKERGMPEADISALFQHTRITLGSSLHEAALGATDVHLSITGPNIQANAALVGELVIESLKKHPATAPLFDAEDKPFLAAQDNADSLALTVCFPKLEIGQYAALFQTLAKKEPLAPAVPEAAVAAEQPPAEAAKTEIREPAAQSNEQGKEAPVVPEATVAASQQPDPAVEDSVKPAPTPADKKDEPAAATPGAVVTAVSREGITQAPAIDEPAR